MVIYQMIMTPGTLMAFTVESTVIEAAVALVKLSSLPPEPRHTLLVQVARSRMPI